MSTTLSDTSDTNNDEDDKNNRIWPTLIIVFFGIVVVVIVLYLVYRINKKRKGEHPISKKSPVDSGESVESTDKGDNKNADVPSVMTEQLKFRGGSMSSVENRHERVPSKPVMISITTPRGTQVAADVFGDYDSKNDDIEKQGLSDITEDNEEEYDQQPVQAQQHSAAQVKTNTGNEDNDNEESEENHWEEYERNKMMTEKNGTQGDEHT
eukprot:CAMPEP_0202696068 /NCGR_PEP_ID=MMETSP1385-20130828/9435_1 /ASSEMBLY_ACC=CAM_ASM_000861 /TAXON_ID=933848 /ORGANISM="Elphidium margaritaceum" /LENGTH=209 /DNA_ID=CAMNT_0049352171 /DNA_START=240 /DNA_END=869 /DNA_ORIENTATION=-